MRSLTRIGRGLALLAALVVLLAASFTARAYEVWVTNQRTDKIQVLDGTSLQVVGEITAGEKPHNVTFSKDAKTAYVANLDPMTSLSSMRRPKGPLQPSPQARQLTTWPSQLTRNCCWWSTVAMTP